MQPYEKARQLQIDMETAETDEIRLAKKAELNDILIKEHKLGQIEELVEELKTDLAIASNT